MCLAEKFKLTQEVQAKNDFLISEDVCQNLKLFINGHLEVLQFLPEFQC